MRAWALPLLGLSIAGAGAACVGIARPATPALLYGDRKQRRPATAVATLYGPIGTVDGEDVSGKASTFELLPGCHVVTLRKAVGAADPTAIAFWSANLPRTVFAFQMKARHSYVIELLTLDSGGPTGELRLTAADRDAGGASTPVAPAASEADVQRCRDWGDALESE